MRWAPNPIALARLAVGGAPDDRPWPDSWDDVEALFADVYKADAGAVFYGRGNAAALIDLFDEAAVRVPDPLSLDKILALPIVRLLADRLSNPEWLPRLLPFIVPVADVDFGPPGTGVAMTEHPHIGSYKRIGALDVGGVSWLDPEQGSTGDCYLISAMISIAWARPRTWRQKLSAATHGSKEAGTLSVAFHDESPSKPDPPPFEVPPRVPLDAAGNWIYAHSAEHKETWPALMERAFVMHVGHREAGEPTVSHYREISNLMFPHQAARILIGGLPFSDRKNSSDPLNRPFGRVAILCEKSLTKGPTIAATLSKPASANDFVEAKLIRDHAYAVLGVMSQNGNNFVVLRNPYGHNPRVADSPGGKWAAGAARNGGAPVSLDRNGVFAISEQRFNACFRAVDGVDLPAD